MRFPFVSRSHHEEVTGDLRGRLVALEKEQHRLLDLIFQNNFGVQLHDSLPVRDQAEPPQTSPAEPEVKASEEDDDLRELHSIRRTRPSQLGNAMARLMAKRQAQTAAAVFPKHTVPGPEPAHPARQMFAAARAEVLKA